MAIDIETEELVKLVNASDVTPGRPHLSTIFRWAERGVRGVRLETVMVGARKYTSKQAIHRFIAKCSGDKSVAPSKERRRRVAAAERRLDQAGVR